MIRLQRIGKKKQPTYRLVLSEKARDTQADNIEILGLYNPMANPKIIDLKKERINYWLSHGAQTSETVHNLLISQGVISGEKRKSVAISKKRRAKMDETEASKAPEAPDPPADEAGATKVEAEQDVATKEEKKEEKPTEEASEAEEKTEEKTTEEKPEEKKEE